MISHSKGENYCSNNGNNSGTEFGYIFNRTLILNVMKTKEQTIKPQVVRQLKPNTFVKSKKKGGFDDALMSLGAKKRFS